MASLAGLEGIALPSFSAGIPEEDARALPNYLYQLNEQLSYVLTNLDTENFSQEFTERENRKGE